MTTPSIISNTASNHPTIPVTNTTMCSTTKSSPPRSSNANANATANANASANATASANANANANETQQQRPRLVRFADDPSQRSAWTSVSSQLSSSADPPKAVRRKSSLTVEGAKLVQALHHCLEDCVFDDDNDDDDDDDETTQEATAIAAASTGAVATAARNGNGNSDTRTIRISLQSATDDDEDDDEDEEEEHETSFPSQRGAWMDQSDSSLHRPPKAAQRKKSLSAEALALVETIFAVVSDREITKKYAETAEDNENNEDNEDNENNNNDRVTNNNIEAQPAPQEDNALPDSSQRIARTSQSESLCPPLCAERNQSLSNDVKNFVEAFVSAMEEDCNDEVDDDDDEVDDDDDDDDDDETDTIVHNATATATAPAIYAADAASTEGQTPTRYRYTRIADEPTRSKSLCPPSCVERRQSLSKGVKTFMEALVSAMEEDSEEGDDDDEDDDDDNDDNDDGDDRFENTTTPTDASPTRVHESMEEQNGGADKDVDVDKDAKRKLPKRTIRFRDDPSQRGAWTSQSRSLCPPVAVERKQSLASEAMNVDAAAAAANDGTPSRTNRRNAHAHARNSLSRSDAQNLIEALVSAMGDLSQREEEEDAIIMHPSQSSSSMGSSSSSNNSRTAWVNPEMRTSERSLRPPSPPERKETLENEAFSSLVGHAESSSL